MDAVVANSEGGKPSASVAVAQLVASVSHGSKEQQLHLQQQQQQQQQLQQQALSLDPNAAAASAFSYAAGAFHLNVQQNNGAPHRQQVNFYEQQNNANGSSAIKMPTNSK
uniref:Uncharacterized protein n=1 Tax=Plectus sambesii TaxID=2011161 RepID=A0A914UPD9_9BILA